MMKTKTTWHYIMHFTLYKQYALQEYVIANLIHTFSCLSSFSILKWYQVCNYATFYVILDENKDYTTELWTSQRLNDKIMHFTWWKQEASWEYVIVNLNNPHLSLSHHVSSFSTSCPCFTNASHHTRESLHLFFSVTFHYTVRIRSPRDSFH